MHGIITQNATGLLIKLNSNTRNYKMTKIYITVNQPKCFSVSPLFFFKLITCNRFNICFYIILFISYVRILISCSKYKASLPFVFILKIRQVMKFQGGVGTGIRWDHGSCHKSVINPCYPNTTNTMCMCANRQAIVPTSSWLLIAFH